jgi:hypothetical protein
VDSSSWSSPLCISNKKSQPIGHLFELWTNIAILQNQDDTQPVSTNKKPTRLAIARKHISITIPNPNKGNQLTIWSLQGYECRQSSFIFRNKLESV